MYVTFEFAIIVTLIGVIIGLVIGFSLASNHHRRDYY